MELCEKNHSQLCFTGVVCPVCECQKVLDVSQRIIVDLENEIEALKDRIKEANDDDSGGG